MFFVMLALPWIGAYFMQEPYGYWFAIGGLGMVIGFVNLVALPVFFIDRHDDRWFMAMLCAYYWILYWVFAS